MTTTCASTATSASTLLSVSGAEFRSADQKRYFRSARGSALECAAVLDICRIRRVGTTEQLQHGRVLLVRIVQMLSKLARSP